MVHRIKSIGVNTIKLRLKNVERKNMINYFEVLNISEDAEMEVIKAAYKALAKKYHPDNTDLSPDETSEKMALINEAFDVLSDETKRKKHIQDLSVVQGEKTKNTFQEKKDINETSELKRKKKPFFKKLWFWIIIIIIGFMGKCITETPKNEEEINNTSALNDTVSELNGVEETMYKVIIRVTYERSEGFNYRDDAKLFLDGEEIANVEYASDEEYYVTLTSGEHEIYLRRDATFRKHKTNKIMINVTSEDTYIPLIAKEDSVKGLQIELDTSVDIQVLKDADEEISGISNTPLEVLKSKAYSEKCETTVCEAESSGYTYINDDDMSYFDEVVLGAWFDFGGKPIADLFPANLDLVLQVHGGNTSRFLEDFYFVDGLGFDIDKLKDKDPSEKATYALVLKDIALLNDEDTNEVVGMVGNDFISGETITVYGGFSEIKENDTLLFFGEYCGIDNNGMPLFVGLCAENITERFTKEELEANAESLIIPTKKRMDLGTLGVDTMSEEFFNLQAEESVIFRGTFLLPSLGATGANLLYVEGNGNNDTKYLFFVDMEDDAYAYKEEGYGFVEEEIAWHARYNYGSDVTEEIVSSYVESRFEEEVVEEIFGDIVQVDKLADNYFVCYMKGFSQTAIHEDMITGVENEKEYLFVGDTVKWSDELEFTVADAGFWVDEYYGSNVFVDISLSGSAFASCDELIDCMMSDMKIWGDGLLLAENPWVQVDGENIILTSSYSLDYQGSPLMLRIYASCAKLSYDNASEIIAELDGIGNVAFYIKGNTVHDKSNKTFNLQDINGDITDEGYNQDIASEYIFPDSDMVFYNEQALYDEYDYDTLRYGKNEIYARHGYIFKSEEYQSYFESMEWYQPTTAAEDFDDAVFNEYEKNNVLVIQNVLDFYDNQ